VAYGSTETPVTAIAEEPVHLDGVLAAWADDAEDRRAVVSVILA